MTETRPKIVAGIDVGKTALELSVAAGPARSYANNADGTPIWWTDWTAAGMGQSTW